LKGANSINEKNVRGNQRLPCLPMSRMDIEIDH